MAGIETFRRELEALGYTPSVEGDFVAIDYEVEVGPLAGETVRLGFKVPADFGLTPPGGPLVSPRLLPLNPDGSAGHPRGAVHPAETGGLSDPAGVWEYWSRPIPHWGANGRTVSAYLCHIRRLFDTLPDELQRSADN